MTVGSQVKQCLASLKSVSSSLSTYASQTHDQHLQREFHEAMLSCENVINDLKKRISVIEREEPQYKGF